MPVGRSPIETRAEPLSELHRHVAIPNAFETWTILDVHAGAEGFELRARRRDQLFRKDYDALEDPLEWPKRFDVSRWTLISAFDGSRRVGGALCAIDTPGVEMLEGRPDLVVLWDLRVAPSVHRQGVGATLFRAVEAWARARHCREVKVETQNTNPTACRFYASQGCRLQEVNRGAYPELPDEIQLIWRKVLNA